MTNILQALYDSGEDINCMHIEALRSEVRRLRYAVAGHDLKIAEAKCAVIAEILLTPGDNLREKIERLHQQFKRELLECLKSTAQVNRAP